MDNKRHLEEKKVSRNAGGIWTKGWNECRDTFIGNSIRFVDVEEKAAGMRIPRWRGGPFWKWIILRGRGRLTCLTRLLLPLSLRDRLVSTRAGKRRLLKRERVRARARALAQNRRSRNVRDEERARAYIPFLNQTSQRPREECKCLV